MQGPPNSPGALAITGIDANVSIASFTLNGVIYNVLLVPAFASVSAAIP